MSFIVETFAEVAITVAFLAVMVIAARRGPEPDLDEFGPLGPGE